MFNKTVALLGFLCLIWASFIFIISKILANKAPSYIEYNDGSSSILKPTTGEEPL